MEKSNRKKPLVFLDISIDGDPVERMTFEVSVLFIAVSLQNRKQKLYVKFNFVFISAFVLLTKFYI